MSALLADSQSRVDQPLPGRCVRRGEARAALKPLAAPIEKNRRKKANGALAFGVSSFAVDLAVLFVDDSEVARAAAERGLREHGIDVVILASSRDAATIDGTKFAAALLDIDLGDGLGTDLARKLRDAAPLLPIAFLTASATASLVDSAETLGPVFSKSRGVEEAISWVARVVSAARSA
jgi:CheY-like chemotaxis protein